MVLSRSKSSAHLHHQRQRLLARIERRFAIVADPMQFGPMRFELIRVKDPDVVLDQVADAGGTAMPYWAELWESAIGLSRYLIENYTGRSAEILEGKRVLDLGCGIGLQGSVAARLGAEVLLADIDRDALLFARINTLFAGSRARVRRVDWQCDDLGEKFDLILGADIVYERSQWEPLEKFWRGHLQTGGAVLLGEPGRQTGEEFVEWICARGWKVAKSEIDAQKKITLMKIRRRDESD